MKKWNLIIDVERCHNCGNCVLSNQDEHVGNDYPVYAASQARGGAWIRIESTARGMPPMVDAAYLPLMCNHCDDAPCVAEGKGAVRKRADGIVIIDPVLAKGRRDLMDACPYGSMHWNEERALPQIWIFDAHLLDQGWREPRCCQACPTGAMQAVKLSDEEMGARASKEKLEVLQAEWGTRPRVYYRHLHRFTQCFLGGSAVSGAGSAAECVSGGEVALIRDGAVLQRTKTDGFGDFKFDGLPRDSGRYRVEIRHPVYGEACLDVELGLSLYLGAVRLQRRLPDPRPDRPFSQPELQSES
ncbi:4Fe-4S dicluster domain-containing protein [Chromobacterium paludis]|uniref:Oxidoreductase n=1 Tax=Chromobacterium paludis TaxID=2605945 RepID=A0A5C1DFS1_9NEIS|nr:4Fe-4S dicluster domain-containing protein [Chromobacterium paludis]QEL55642.1 oxidoreductase [Chromobacterium paludis]